MDIVYIIGMTPRNLTQLQHRLRKGSSPGELNARQIGQGAQKIAYVIKMRISGKPYIVKEDTGGYGNPEQRRPPDLKKYGCDTIYQLRAGSWIIQELVTVLNDIDEQHPVWKIYRKIRSHASGDYHCKNFGIRKDGSLVCFDW